MKDSTLFFATSPEKEAIEDDISAVLNAIP